MEEWVVDCGRLLGQWSKVAAEKALIRLSQDRTKSTNELLMGYALARELLSEVLTRFAAEKQTLSNEGAEKLEIAVKLARVSIPQEHPLWKSFMKEVSFISEEYSDKK
jgi:acetylornithine/succinyldiaminopimelate/putrescine aminotransferase